jgi:transglutaminase-like putative cysteine protease
MSSSRFGSRLKMAYLIVVIFSLALSASCTDKSETEPDELFLNGRVNYTAGSFIAAAAFFDEAARLYDRRGESEKARTSKNWKFRAERVLFDYSLSRDDAEREINLAFPDVPAERRNSWFENGELENIISDREELFFTDIVRNVYYRNFDLMREKTGIKGRTPFYDDLHDLVFGPQPPQCEPYCNPRHYEGEGRFSVPRNLLPEIGTLRLWVPVPVTTDTQFDVSVIRTDPAQYVKVSPSIEGDIGIVYYEIPLDEQKEDIEVVVTFSFSEYEQRFRVDPSKVKPYDTESHEYKKYTRSSQNIQITPEIKNAALSMVGDEQNPYNQAALIYRYITRNVYYSHAPHFALNTLGIAESVYVAEHGYGDCGSQSMYFSALCRSLGIPARTCGGLQLVPGLEGDHFWAEFYIEGYGWIPVDVTVAEAADWSYNATENEREEFKDFFFQNLDNYRFVIQKDVDIPLTPDPGDAVILTTARQFPAAVCNSSKKDIELILSDHWNFSITSIN